MFVCVECLCMLPSISCIQLSNLRLLFPTNFLFLQFWNCAEIRIVGSGSSEEEEYIPELQEATTLVIEEVDAVVGW